MMLKVGDVLDLSPGLNKLVRVVWVTADGTSVAIYPLDADLAFPELVQAEPLETRLRSREMALVKDPFMAVVMEDKLKETHKNRRDRAWKLIKPLVAQAPYIFSADRRGTLISDAVENARKGNDPNLKRVTVAQVYLYLRRYWQRGMTANALLPDYEKSGGRGKTRQAGEKKRGRPRRFGKQKGTNVTPDMRKVFSVAYDRYYASQVHGKYSLRGAYNKMISEFYSVKGTDAETGQILHFRKEEIEEQGGIPSFEQFQYWSNKDHLRLEIKRKRMGAKLYDKDLRGLLGTSNAEVIGPGSRYQIDATIADVYLVSQLDPNLIIGRPVLYVVIDVFSRLIVGIYVGLEGPSWVSAMMALANTAMDKVEYCAQFGITIQPEDWPAHFLPGTFLGDRGEIESEKIDTLINNFNVSVENTSSYRADWKGIVESRFRLLPAKFKAYTPGYIDVDYRQRGGTDYRLDAVLNLDDFTKVIINCVLHYNNSHEITTYDYDRDVKADGVPAIPCDLWEWGIRHRSGVLRAFPEELVKFSLMPKDQASVTETGIAFRGRFYTCKLAMEQRWFDKARQDGRWKVDVSYDPRDMDRIYLHSTEAKIAFEECTLTDRSRADRHLSSWEIDQVDQRDKHRRADARTDAVLASANTDAANEEVIKAAVERRGEPSQASAARRTSNIRGNRAEEKEANRTTETFRLGQDASGPARPSAEIVPIRGKAAPTDDTDYSLPSIDEILGDDDVDGI